MKYTLPRTALLLSCASLAFPAAAETNPEENTFEEGQGRITVTATRTPVVEEEVPATISIITDEQIADQLITDARDLVRYEPGVTVRRQPARFGAAQGQTGRARNEDFVIRGIGGNRVLIQVDGIRSPQGFSFGPQLVGRANSTDVSLVKQVEILRGPASALYGSDGLAGAISYTTADPVDLLGGASFGGFARAQYSGQDDELAETVALAAQSSNVSGFVAFTRRDFKELKNQGDIDGVGPARTLPNPQDGYSNAALGKLVFESGPHRVRLTGEWLENQVVSNILSGQRPVFFGPPIPGTQAWTVDRLDAEDSGERWRTSLDWTFRGDDEGIIEYAFLSAYYQNGEDTQFAEEDRTSGTRPAPDRTRLNTFDNEVYGLAAEARSSFGSSNFRHTLAFGGDVSWTRQEGVRDGTVPPFGETYPTRAFPITDYTLGGVFIADEINLFGGTVTVFPALRFDFYDLDPSQDEFLPDFVPSPQSDNRISPKLGVTVKVAENALIFGNYAQGFLAPTPSQVNNFFENLAFGYTSLPNPDLGPETSESFELGARYSGEIFSLQVVGFKGDYDDFISQQVVGGSFRPSDPAIFQFVNFNQVKIDGLEIKGSANFDNGITARLAVAYADGDVIDPDGTRTPLDTIDPFNLVAGIGYRAPDGRFGGELILSYNGRKEAGEVSDVALVRPDASTVIDMTAFFKITDAIKLRAGVFNLLDDKYAIWSDVRGLTDASIEDAFTRPGRNLSASLSFEF